MASSSIQQVNSCPDYINKFIQHNMEKLLEIYNEGINVYNEGCLGFKCSQEESKMDVMFMSPDNITNMITAGSWENLKLSIPEDKKLFFVKDEGLNAIFLIYI